MTKNRYLYLGIWAPKVKLPRFLLIIMIKTVNKYNARRCRTIFPLIEVIDTNRCVQNKSDKKVFLHSIWESEGIQPIGLAHLKLHIPLIEPHLKAISINKKATTGLSVISLVIPTLFCLLRPAGSSNSIDTNQHLPV